MSLPFKLLWAWLKPRYINSAAGFVIAGAGDLFCQRYFEDPQNKKPENQEFSSKALPEITELLSRFPKKEKDTFDDNSGKDDEFQWDKGRSLDMAIIRAVFIAPFVGEWYPLLVRLCPGSSLPRVIGRIAIDQAIGSPYVILNVFAANSYLHDGNLYGTVDRIKSQFFNTWTAGLQYWPFVHLVTFGVIPPQYQTLFAHFASVYWNAVLSYYANKSNVKVDEKVIVKPEAS